MDRACNALVGLALVLAVPGIVPIAGRAGTLPSSGALGPPQVASGSTALQPPRSGLLSATEAALPLADILRLADADTPETARDIAARIAPQLGVRRNLARAAAPAPVPAAAKSRGKIALGSLRLALTQFAIFAGARSFQSVIDAQVGDAQGGAEDALYLLEGQITLAGLAAAKTGGIEPVAGGVRLLRPLIVWPGASLRLGPGERLELDRAHGAFVLSFGGLGIDGGAIVATTEPNTGTPGFAPFVSVAGPGVLTAVAATFEGLGNAGTKKLVLPADFGGVSIISGTMFRPSQPSRIENSMFRETQVLRLRGASGIAVTGNAFSGEAIRGILAEDVSGAVFAQNSLGRTANYAAIHLRGGSNDVLLGNVVTASRGVGILIDHGMSGVRVEDNVIANATASGIEINSASCVRLSRNIVAGSGSAGIRLRDSAGAKIAGNAVLASSGAGLAFEAQRPGSRFELSDNFVALNREGLRATGLTSLGLSGDRLAIQTPRLFAGDLMAFQPQWLRAPVRLDVRLERTPARPDQISDCGGEL